MLSPQDEEFLKEVEIDCNFIEAIGIVRVKRLLRIVEELKSEIEVGNEEYCSLSKERDGLREELEKEKLAHWSFHKDQADSFKNKS